MWKNYKILFCIFWSITKFSLFINSVEQGSSKNLRNLSNDDFPRRGFSDMQCTVHYIRCWWLTKLVIYWWCSNTKVPLVMMMVPLVMMMVRLVMVPLAMLVVMVQLKLHSQDLCGVSFHLDLPWVATHSQCWEWMQNVKMQFKLKPMQCNVLQIVVQSLPKLYVTIITTKCATIIAFARMHSIRSFCDQVPTNIGGRWASIE